MKLIKLNQIEDPSAKPMRVSPIWINRDILRWAYQVQAPTSQLIYTKLTLIADDKALNILESPDEINKLCNYTQGVKLVRRKVTSLRGEI